MKLGHFWNLVWYGNLEGEHVSLQIAAARIRAKFAERRSHT